MSALLVDTSLDAATEPTPTYCPGPVRAALRLLAVPESVLPAVAPDAEVVPREMTEAQLSVLKTVRADHRVGDLPEAWVEEELQLLEAVEQVKAWADFQGLAALRRLREAVGELVRDRDDSSWVATGRGLTPTSLSHESDTATVDEMMLATGLSAFEVTRRLQLAQDEDGRGSVLLCALASGDVSLDRALRIHTETRSLGPELARAVAVRLLARNEDGSIRSHQQLRRELRRQVALHTPNTPETLEQAIADRTSYAVLEADGTGTVVVTGEAARVTAAAERVDDLARRMRADGDRRTLTQLRSDVALDLLLYGWCSPDQVTGQIAEMSARTFVGQAPAAHVNVVVGLSTLLALDNAPAEIPGYGFVTGEHARQLCHARGSVWRRLVTDPVTGAALDLSTRRYRPTAAMADMVAALDLICRAPGCVTAAHRCDIDHDRPRPSGPTAVSNLSGKHRRHHNHKTRGVWTAVTDQDGGIVWRTAAARRYETRRHDYHSALGQPVSEAEIVTAWEHDPPPF